MQVLIEIPDEEYKKISNSNPSYADDFSIYYAIKNGTPLTPNVLADALMEERIKGKLDSDTTFEKDIIRDVKCTLTVSIRDRRPCYCGVREVWRESKVQDGDSN